MEDAEKTGVEEMLMCPVCQDIFKDPRQLPCGHSMCMGCLENLMDHSDVPFRCPDCRAQFGQVVRVQKNYALTSIAEDFRVNRRIKEKQMKCVYCDYCLENKTLAIKTCLKCEVSLCKEHVKDHLRLPVFTGHPLVQPVGDILDRKCPQHEDEVLKYYCTSSRRYICNICALQSKQLDVATEASTVLRRHLTQYMDQHFKMLLDQITKSTGSITKLQEDIQRDKQKVSRADSRLNGVTVVALFLWFIVLYYAYSYSVENQMFESQREREHHNHATIAGPLTWDLDTASRLLKISADLQTAERVKAELDYPDGDSCFDAHAQVLSSQCFSSGTHGWEVEAEGCWVIAVSYKSIQRKNIDSKIFGYNAESWSLAHFGNGMLFAVHDGRSIFADVTLQSGRIAVVVNFEEGSIKFSAVGSATKLLHEFKATLTQTACLGLGLHLVDPPSRASIVKAW
ncbi:nuclear factor 7, ovary-like isoform X2 [Embiotoca jacksoni]|uniref:nuclear factor 7, ovary-like isoform X2 n=1 Tax=Embiotoca jacksoni TaxID=100190 RepID=UPI00370411F9